MRILTLNILLIFCILLNFPLALADHQLKKSTEEILETHNYRLRKKLKKIFDDENFIESLKEGYLIK